MVIEMTTSCTVVGYGTVVVVVIARVNICTDVSITLVCLECTKGGYQ